MSLLEEFDDDCDVCSEFVYAGREFVYAGREFREFVKVVARDKAEAPIAVAT